MDQHDLDTVDLVGHSLGGAVGLHIAMRARDRVPRAEVVEIPVGHSIHAAAPTEFAAAVIPFLT